MVELSEIWSTVMNALIEGPVAWRSPAEVAAAIGLGEAETTDMLCELDVAGWVDGAQTGNSPIRMSKPLTWRAGSSCKPPVA